DLGDGRSRHDQLHPEPLRITPPRHPQKICTHPSSPLVSISWVGERVHAVDTDTGLPSHLVNNPLLHGNLKIHKISMFDVRRADPGEWPRSYNSR
ncbi:hypothetical protein ACH4PR_52495, partial [Streptomyces mirabilis]|uniref:hypothetical protein n=1 Tax=Streptomyces mirabilis TaxID=68239 RepID=UPI0037A464F7